MNIQSMIRVISILLLAGLLWACGSDNEQVAEGGIGGTGITSGPINGFGSIIVNGIHFDVGGAKIYVAGERVEESALRPGMVVTVFGVLGEGSGLGTASQVEFDFDLVARIDEVAADYSWFSAQGQVVLVDELTVFDDYSKGELLARQGVYVSALAGNDGGLVARYVRVVAASEPLEFGSGSDSVNAFGDGAEGVMANEALDAVDGSDGLAVVELSGAVTQLDAVAQRFVLGSQPVDYSTALFVDVDISALQEGVWFWLKGHVNGDVVIASQIELRIPPSVPGAKASLTGLVTQVDSANHFKMLDRVVNIDADTRFVNGGIADLVANAVVVVHGETDIDRVLAADEIRFMPSTSMSLQGQVEFVSDNVVTLAGVELALASTTLMLDSSSVGLHRFSIADIAVGDKLLVYAHQSADGLVLTRLERVDSF